MPITFFTARSAPDIATPTYPRFPTNIITGCMIPDMNCDFHAESYSTSLVSLKIFSTEASLLNALITNWPAKFSSTCPLMIPRYFCWVLKCFCDSLMMIPSSTPETGIVITAIRVINGEIVSIITITPIIVATEVRIIVTLWFKPVPSVSTSLVILDSTSPYW